MLSKSSTKKLKQDLRNLKVSHEYLATETGISKPTIIKLLNAETYNADGLRKIIAIRNQKKMEASELEELI